MDDNELLKTPAPEAMDNAPLFVSLYVVLLAFFILLNAISEYSKEKVQEVVDSVNNAFSLKQAMIMAPEMQIATGAEVSIAQFFDEVGKTAATLVALEDLDIVRADDAMEMRFPVDRLFAEDQTIAKSEAEFFVNDIAKSLATWLKGYRIETSFMLGVARPLPDAPRADHSLEVARAGYVARIMVQRGVDPKSIAIGIRQGDPGMITMKFSVRGEDASKLNLVSPPSGAATGASAPPPPAKGAP